MNPEFFLFPFDRRRPRLRNPRADFEVQTGGKEFSCRAQNGILFGRDLARNDEEFTLALSTPLSPILQAFPEKQRDFWCQEWDAGRVARFALWARPGSPQRLFPLFFGQDGRGFCRESWNDDDLPFTHDVSFHDWLEAPASRLGEIYAASIFESQIAPQLEALDWPTSRDISLDWPLGSRDELKQVAAWLCALENDFQNCGALIRLSISSESPFNRGGVRAVECGALGVQVQYDYASDERQLAPWGNNELRLSQRFWQIFDLAFDQNPPRGFLFDINERFIGRLSTEPLPRDFALQIPVSRLLPASQARIELEKWLENYWPKSRIEAVLSDDEPEVIPEGSQ